MGYLDTWKVLDAMIADLRQKGVMPKLDTMVELRSAKALISVLVADPTCPGISQKVDECLFNVESSIMAEAQMLLGNEYVDEWSYRMNRARKEPVDDEEETQPILVNEGFPLGLPRNSSWIRFGSLPEFPVEKLKKLAEVSQVSCILQSNGSLLIHGENDQLRKFIKNVAQSAKT